MPRFDPPRLPKSARHIGVALLVATVAGLAAAAAAAEPITTTADLLKDSRFQRAYASALGPKAQLPWAARLSNSAPVRRHVFRAVDYQVATPCKPHDCADHNLLLLYAPASGQVFGHLNERGRVTTIGNPDPDLARELARLWKQEFRSHEPSEDPRMTRYCGEIRQVAGTTGGGFVAVANEDRFGNVSVPIGGLVRVATEIPVLQIGDTTLKKVRLCMAEVAPFLRVGDRACVFAFGHLLRKQIIIGVKSETGPSWTMSFPRFVATFITYLTLWPVLVGLAGALIGALVGMLFGNTGSTIGLALGMAYGVGISLLSAARLLITYRQMQAH